MALQILIADDNPRLRAAIRELLSVEGGWEICGETWNGPDTLKKARELQPDLVLLDVRMPFPNGFEIARSIRQELPRTRILIMSGYDLAELLPSALDVGADACLDKARLGRDLVRAIKNLQSAITHDLAPR